MKTKAYILLKLSFLTGAIPFIGGWGIFITWLLGRYLNASDFENLEIIGFMWMIICFFVAIGGLIILLLYVLINRQNLHKNMLITLFVILINIPSVFIILEWQKKVAGMQFVKVTNQSGFGKLDCSVLLNNQIIDSKTIYKESSKVIYFEHYYYFTTFDPYQDNSGLIMHISGNGIEKEIPFSELNYGNCKQIIVQDNLKVVNKMEGYETSH